MRRASLAASVLLLAGCAGARQQAAEDAVAARAPGTSVACTRSARVGYLNELKTKEFICIAKRGSADCDRWLVTVRNKRFVPRLQRRNADCLLPPS